MINHFDTVSKVISDNNYEGAFSAFWCGDEFGYSDIRNFDKRIKSAVKFKIDTSNIIDNEDPIPEGHEGRYGQFEFELRENISELSVILPFSTCYFEFFDGDEIDDEKYKCRKFAVIIDLSASCPYRRDEYINPYFSLLSGAIRGNDIELHGVVDFGIDRADSSIKINAICTFLDIEDDKDKHIMKFTKSSQMRHCVVDAIKALNLIACSNVVIKNNIQYKQVRKGSSKKGKLPLYSYKTLEIKRGKYNKNSEHENEKSVSPRLHMRRGHIRRLSKDKSVFVSSCMVGDIKKGIANKDYAA